MRRPGACNHRDRQFIAGLEHVAHLARLHALNGGANLLVISKLRNGTARSVSRHIHELQVQLGSDLLRVLGRFYKLGVRFIGQILHPIENGLILERGYNRRLYLIQRLQVRGLLLQHLNDMEAVFGGNHVADLIGLQREDGVFEILDHLAAGNPTQISAFLSGTGVLRILLS